MFSVQCSLLQYWVSPGPAKSAYGGRAIPAKAGVGQNQTCGNSGVLEEVLALSVAVTVELAESEVCLLRCHGGYREGLSLFEPQKFPHFPTVAYPRPGTIFTG